MNYHIKNNLKVIIAVIITAIVCIGTTAYAIIKINADQVDYNGTPLDQVLDQLYANSGNNNAASSEVKSILSLTNTTIEMKDLSTSSFLSKVATSKEAAKIVLDSSSFRSVINADLLNSLDVALVPTVSDNTNVIYSSQYSNNYAANLAFATASKAWCTASGSNNNSYIGYNFNKDVSVSVVSFYNGGFPESYPIKKAKLQYSNDNVTWEDASDVYTFENKKADVFIFNTNTTNAYQYWRVYILETYSSYAEMSKLQFYGI